VQLVKGKCRRPPRGHRRAAVVGGVRRALGAASRASSHGRARDGVDTWRPRAATVGSPLQRRDRPGALELRRDRRSSPATSIPLVPWLQW